VYASCSNGETFSRGRGSSGATGLCAETLAQNASAAHAIGRNKNDWIAKRVREERWLAKRMKNAAINLKNNKDTWRKT
jgi:hypothetical protein